MQEANRTLALVADAAGELTTPKQVFYGGTLAFKGQVMPEPLDFSHACAAAVNQSSGSDKKDWASSLDSFMEVVVYPRLSK